MSENPFPVPLGLGGGANPKRAVKEITTPAGYVIPESFLVKPEDTDEVREAKKKKIHAVKNQQKSEKQEQDAVKKQQGWQKFQAVSKVSLLHMES